MIRVFLWSHIQCTVNSTLAIMLNGYVEYQKDIKRNGGYPFPYPSPIHRNL